MTRLLATAVVASALAACGFAAAAPPETASDVEHYLVELERIHPAPYHAVSKAEYRAAADRLIARLPELDDDQLMVELLRLVALLGERDGHANMNPLAGGHRRELHLYPIATYEFADGVYVVAAPGRPQLVGRKLVAIQGRPIAEVLRTRRPTRDLRQRALARRAPQPVPRDGRDPPRGRDHADRRARRVLGRGCRRHRAHARHRRRVHQRAPARLPELPRRDAEAVEAALRPEARRVAMGDDARQGSRRLLRLQHRDGRPDGDRGPDPPARATEEDASRDRRPAQQRRRRHQHVPVPAADAQVARDQQARKARRADRAHDVLRRRALRRRPEARDRARSSSASRPAEVRTTTATPTRSRCRSAATRSTCRGSTS